MEIKQLKSFKAVVDYGNFTKAAEKTFTSQPTISTHIKALEEELGVSLIVRDTKNIEVTQKGMELYECAANILELEDRLIRRWNDENRNIIAAAMPELPARLQIVYGNKWVDGRFNAFLKTRLSVYLIDTDYVPAFLATPLEVCLYLFLMDYCIIKENYTKVKDEDLKQFLHIFKASPMLRIKKLL